MPRAWLNALGETAVTRTPCAPPQSFVHLGYRIGRLGVDYRVGAHLARQRQLLVRDIDGDYLKAHGLRVLDRDVTQSPDAGNDHRVIGLGIGLLQPFVDGHASTEDRSGWLKV